MPERLPGVSTASPHPHVAVIEPTHRDLDLVFAALPGATVVFAADAPHFTVIAAIDTLLAGSNRPREAVVGRPLAEAFPNASPADPEARGLTRVRGALEAAVRTGVPQPMPRQRYDLQRPDGQWEERYWDAVNTPVHGADGTVRYVLHQTEDVTARVHREQAAADELQVTAAHLAERTAQAEAAAAALADSEARYRLAA